MNYLLETIGASIKSAFDSENAVGVSVIMDIPETQDFIDVVANVFKEQQGYLVMDGIHPEEYKCPRNLYLSGNVEMAVKWRNQKEAQNHIVFYGKKSPKRSHSLGDFYKLTPRDIVKSIAKDQSSNAQNEPIKRFWSAIETFEGSFPLKKMQKFLESVDGKKSGFEKELWQLELIPDSKILTPGVDVPERIRRNRQIIEQLNSMDDSIRNNITASLAHFNDTEKKAYRLILDYFRNGKFHIFKELDLDQVSNLITKTKTRNDQSETRNPDSDDIDSVLKPQPPQKIVMENFVKALSGDVDAKNRTKELGTSIVEYTRNHNPFDDDTTDEKPSVEDLKTGATIVFPLAKLDRNLYKLVMNSSSKDNWGGVVFSNQANLHDTIADADAICGEPDAFKPFHPVKDEINPFFTKNTGLRTELFRFDSALAEKEKNSTLVEKFDKIVETREIVLPYLDALIRYGHLPTFGCNRDASKAMHDYVESWKALYDEFERLEEDIHEISDKEYQHTARCLLSLDVLFIRINDEWKAIMLPTNPLFLWIYSEIYGQIEKNDYNFAEDEFRRPFLKSLEDLPNLINFQLVPREIYAIANSGANDDYILPCSGAQGILPTFENKTNRYLGSDGLECIEDTIHRYLSFAPYAGNDLRICAVDVPDVMECVRSVVKCILNRNSKEKNSVSATIEIYLTESHSGGREMEDLDFVKQDSDVSDLIQTDALRIKVVHCKNVTEVTEALKKDPVHLAFYFDQSTYQVSYGRNTRELYITPLVVTYDFKYDAISHDGEIFPNTDTSNGFLGSYYGILDKTGSTCSQSHIPRTSYLKTQELEQILDVIDKHYTQWMIAADRVVYNYVPKDGLPIGVKNFGRRNVCIWANKNSRVIQQFMILLKKYNLHPSRKALIEVFNRFGHISGEGLVGIPAKSPGASESANAHRKGMLGTVFAAKWYADRYPGALIASLDSDEGRTWLSKTEEETTDNNRADLVGFRLAQGNAGILVDVIEVKTRSAENKDFSMSTINGTRVIKGHAADQIAYVLKRLNQVFQCDIGDNGNMFIAARRETLKYQVVNECFRSKYLDSSQIQEWSKRLKGVFSGSQSVTVSGTILHVDLENNMGSLNDDKGYYNGESEFEISVVSLTASRIQHEIFGDRNEAETSETSPLSSTMQNDSNIGNLEEPIKSDENLPDDKVHDETKNAISNQKNSSIHSDENIPELVKSFWRACNSFSIRIAECDPDSAKVGPSVIRFYLKLQTGQKIDTLRKSLPDIGRQIARTQIRIQQVENTDKIAVDVVRNNREFVPFEGVVASLPETGKLEDMPILIGRTPEGEDIIRQLNEMPHLLVGGTTGSGKSVFLSTILLSLLIRHPKKEQLQLLITSSKPEDFIAFERLPHLMSNGILASAEDAIDYIKKEVFQESERRQKLFISEQVSKISLYNQHMREKGAPQLPPVVVLVDEFADLTDNIDNKDDRDAFFRTLRQIAQAGRSRGIHLILCTQRPSAKLLDTNIKAQLPGRVALMVADANSAKMILDTPDSGAERLQGRGDLLFKENGGMLSRAQGYSLNLDNLFEIVNQVLR